jgi:plasmid stability protein
MPMATLYVRDVPEDLYTVLRVTAEASGRSISATTVEILRRELSRADELALPELLERAARVRARAQSKDDSVTVVDDLRDDRER